MASLSGLSLTVEVETLRLCWNNLEKLLKQGARSQASAILIHRISRRTDGSFKGFLRETSSTGVQTALTSVNVNIYRTCLQ